MKTSLLWLVLFWWLQLQTHAAERAPLRILSLLPAAHPALERQVSDEDDLSLLSAVNIAVKHVNDREDVLDGYELEVVDGVSGCEYVQTTRLSFVSNVFATSSDQSFIGTLGPLCPESVMAIADLTSKQEIALVNLHLASSYSLETNPHNFSFSMLSPASHLVAALIAYIKHAGWKRLSVLYESEKSFYGELFQDFMTRVQMEALDLVTEVTALSDLDDIPHTLSALKDSDYRVVLLFTGETFASRVLCLSVEEGLSYPNYQWGIIQTNLMEIESCVTGFNKYLKGVFLISHKTGLSSSQNMYNPLYYRYNTTEPHINGSTGNNKIPSQSIYGALLYDSVWTFALALNNSIGILDKRGVSPTEYRYSMPEISGIIEQEMFELEFDGISGHVDFGRDRFSTRAVEVRQIISEDRREVTLATYSSANFTVFPRATSLEIIADSFPKSTQVLHPGVNILFFILLFVHWLVLVIIHIVIFAFRDESSVKASSNRMNHFNIAGNYLIFSGLCLNNVVKAFSNEISHKAIGNMCHAIWPWAISIGSTLITGSISLKTWRIYRIFFYYLQPGPTISDKALSLFLSLLVGVDILIAVTWTATDPVTIQVVSEQVTDTDGYIFIQQSLVCTSDSIQIWLAIIMFYKIIQLAALLTLAILTRKITNKKFTTLNLRIVSYTFVFTVGLGFTLFYFLFFIDVKITIDYVVLNVLLHSIVLQNIALVLLPPLLPVIKRKLRLNHKATSSSSSNNVIR